MSRKSRFNPLAVGSKSASLFSFENPEESASTKLSIDGNTDTSKPIKKYSREAALSASPSPYVSTLEASVYLKYQSTSAVRSAVARGQLHPCGRGPRGTLFFTKDELDEFVAKRFSPKLISSKRHVTLEQKGVYDATTEQFNKIPGSQESQRWIIPNSLSSQRFKNRQVQRGRQVDSSSDRTASRGVSNSALSAESVRSKRTRGRAHEGWGLREIVAEIKGGRT